jgi:polysaccharide deacetylase family protein (PEP-CTERM system associated)
MLVRKREFGFAIVALGVVLGARVWIRWSGTLPESFVMLTFALVCILLSWMIGAFKANRRKPGNQPPVLEPSKSLPSGVALISHRGPQLVKPGAATPITNAFTIDLEDYFQTEVSSRAVSYEDWDHMPTRVEFSTMRLLDLLDENETKSTVFVLGWVARKYPRLIREVARRGHEIGCHSFQHRPISRLEPNVFYADTRLAKETIEDITGVALRGYRAPNFSLTPGTEWAPDILSELGFQYDSSVNPVRHPLYGNSDAPRHPYHLGKFDLVEIPIATWRVAKTNFPIGGGAYLRLLPYSYIRAGLTVMNLTERKPATVYVHPWEIDHYQPILAQDWKSHIRQTWGTSRMEDKLSHLLQAFRFAPIAQVYAQALQPTQPAFSAMPQRATRFVEVIS